MAPKGTIFTPCFVKIDYLEDVLSSYQLGILLYLLKHFSFVISLLFVYYFLVLYKCLSFLFPFGFHFVSLSVRFVYLPSLFIFCCFPFVSPIVLYIYIIIILLLRFLFLFIYPLFLLFVYI